MSQEVTAKHMEGVIMSGKESAHINVTAYCKDGYAGTVRVHQDTQYLKMVTGWELPIIEVSQSPLRFAVFIEPRHKKQHPFLW